MIKAQGKIDSILLIVAILLVVFGVVMVFSASYYSTISAQQGPYYYLSLAARWAIAGFIVLLIASVIPYRVYYKLAPAIIIVSLVMLALLFTPLGEEINGSTRWIRIGELTFMPGELAKLAVIVGAAWYYTKYAAQVKTFLRGCCFAALFAVAYFYLIYKQPNLATAIIVVLTLVIMMYISGVRVGYLLIFAVSGALYMYNQIMAGGGEHVSRVKGYLDPFADAQGDFFQTVQGLLALGTGGLTGVGLGNSVEKALWLPFAQNDFIFAIIGSETGFLGCIAVLIAYTILIWRCILIAMRSRDRFAMLLCGGVGILFAVQVSLNVGVVTGLLPPTGVTLPLISYGGNATILFMFLIGVVLNVSRGDGEEISARRRRVRREEAA